MNIGYAAGQASQLDPLIAAVAGVVIVVLTGVMLIGTVLGNRKTKTRHGAAESSRQRT